MGTEVNSLFFAVLRSVFHGKPISDGERTRFTREQLPELQCLAQKHDLAHLLAMGLADNRLYLDEAVRMKQTMFQAAYRYEKLNQELLRACAALEAAQIPFIPLKGSVLRSFYPEPWMRTSCDVDILVRSEDVERAADYLVEKCQYTKKGHGTHDISLYSQGGNHVELHYDLVENGWAGVSAKILRQVWDTAHVKSGYAFWREMADEMFYFYHIAHMAKHFEQGGCGVRPFIDLWILDHMEGINITKRDNLLAQGGLLQFAHSARKLCRVWMDAAAPDAVTEKMENYIIRGGVYGSTPNRIEIQQQQKGGRLEYALSKIVIPYEVIKYHYPILQKHRWLTPLMQVRRWCKLMFCGHAKQSLRELSYSQRISKEKEADAEEMLREVGLQANANACGKM